MGNKNTEALHMAPLSVRLLDMFRTVGPEILVASCGMAQDLFQDAVKSLRPAGKASSKYHRFDLWGNE